MCDCKGIPTDFAGLAALLDRATGGIQKAVAYCLEVRETVPSFRTGTMQEKQRSTWDHQQHGGYLRSETQAFGWQPEFLPRSLHPHFLRAGSLRL